MFILFVYTTSETLINAINHVVHNNYDICTVTETWLMENDDKCRADLTQCEYTFLDEVRDSRRGGDTGIIFKKEFNIAKLNAGSKSSFEFSEWNYNYNYN